MKSITIINSVVAMLFAGLSSLNAQNVESPDVGRARMVEVQDLTPSGSPLDGMSMALNVRQFKATVGNGEAWIPLGRFGYGVRHRLVISTTGSHGNSSGVCEFSLHWNSGMVTHLLSQNNKQSRFKLYSYKVGTWQGVALKFTNTAPTGYNNNVYVAHYASHSGAWLDHQPDAQFFASLTESNRMKAAIEQHSGYTYASEGLVPGIKFNQNVDFNKKITITDDVTFTNGAVLKGNVILDQPQGDISMGAFGN